MVADREREKNTDHNHSMKEGALEAIGRLPTLSVPREFRCKQTKKSNSGAPFTCLLHRTPSKNYRKK